MTNTDLEEIQGVELCFHSSASLNGPYFKTGTSALFQPWCEWNRPYYVPYFLGSQMYTRWCWIVLYLSNLPVEVYCHTSTCANFFSLLTLTAPHCSHSWNMRESLQAFQVRNWRRPRQAFSLQGGTLTVTIFSVTSGPKQWIWVSARWKGTRNLIQGLWSSNAMIKAHEVEQKHIYLYLSWESFLWPAPH